MTRRHNAAQLRPGSDPVARQAGDGKPARAIAGAAVALALCALAGCATGEAPVTVPMRVEIPVATPVYCNAPAMEKPALPIAALTADSAPADTIRAYAETVAILKGAVERRDLMLAGCAKPQAQDQGKEVGDAK